MSTNKSKANKVCGVLITLLIFLIVNCDHFTQSRTIWNNANNNTVSKDELKSHGSEYFRIRRDDSSEVKPIFAHELGIYVVPAVASQVNKIIKKQADNTEPSTASTQPVTSTSTVATTQKTTTVAAVTDSTGSTSAPKSTKTKKKLFVPNLYG